MTEPESRAAESRVVALAPRLGLAVVAVVYLWLAPIWIFGGDNAEFSTIGFGGGIAHAPGYPLYTLYLQAMQWLPGTTPAHTAALATALLGIAAVAILYRACIAWGGSPLAALVATGAFAGAPLTLIYYTEAEVFALNGIFVAAILWLAAIEGPARGLRRIAWLGLVGGLAASHHPSAGLVFPIGFLGIARGWRELESKRWRAAVVGIATFLVGLAPILLFFTQRHGLQIWRDIHDVDSLLDQVLRRDYGVFRSGGTFDVVLADTWGLLAHSIADALRWIGLVPLVIGFARGWTRPPGRETRATWIALGLAVLLTGPVFIARVEIPIDGYGKDILERFHILPLLLLVPATAIGVDAIAGWLQARGARLQQLRPSVVAIAALAGFPLAAVASAPRVSTLHSSAFERYVENTLRSLPVGAVLVGTQDSLVFGATYVQRVLSIRPDVVHVDTTLVFMNEPHVRRVVTALGYDPVPERRDDQALRELARNLLRSRRAVFVDVARVEQLFGRTLGYPYGTAIRVVTRPRDLLSLDAVEKLNRELLDTFVMDYPIPHPDDGWQAAAQFRYAATWIELARLYHGFHRDEDAARCDAQAALLSPQ